MVKRYLNIAPRRSENFYITKTKLIYGLIVFLALIAVYKTYAIGNLRKDLIDAKAETSLANIANFDRVDEMNKTFTTGVYCGWKLVGNDGTNLASPDYANTILEGKVYERAFNRSNNIQVTLSVCFRGLEKIDSSTRRSSFFIFFIAAAAIFLIYTDNEKRKTIPEA